MNTENSIIQLASEIKEASELEWSSEVAADMLVMVSELVVALGNRIAAHS